MLVSTAPLAAAFVVQAQYITGQSGRYDFVTASGVTAGASFVVDSTAGAVEVPLNSPATTASYDLFDADPNGEGASIVIRGRKNANFAPSPNKVRFSFPNLPGPAFRNARLATPMEWPGLDGSRLTVAANFIELDFGGLKDNLNYRVQINFDNPGFHLPRVSVRVSQVELCWNAVVGGKYQLQYQEGSVGIPWTNIGSPFSATSDPMCLTQPVVALPRFYRVVGLP
jgi:hypothetical protein